MINIFLYITFLIPIMALGQNESDSILILNSNFVMDTADYVILPFNKKYFPTDSRPLELMSDDIVLLEKMIIQSVKDYNLKSSHNQRLLILNNYKIQFRAFLSKKDKKLIHIHFSHKDSFKRHHEFNKQWKEQVVGAIDGGYWYFKIWTDWSEQKVIELTVNFN
jgi:hypothetical protein